MTKARWKLDVHPDRVRILRDDEALFEAVHIGGCESDPWGYPYDGADRDGADIVRACNSHDMLLAACKRLADAAETYAGSAPDMPSHKDSEAEFDAALESARAAIESAREEA